jgi:hypothetical protein
MVFYRVVGPVKSREDVSSQMLARSFNKFFRPNLSSSKAYLPGSNLAISAHRLPTDT